MSQTPIPVAVIGVGNMGRNHVRVYDELGEASLVEVVEPDPKRASEIGDQYGNVAIYESVEELTEARAVSIAVPTHLHCEVTESCLQAGLNVLLEKPLAPTVSEAKDLVKSIQSTDAVFQIGHIERFNPAVESLERILQNQDIVALEANRLGAYTEHLSEDSVVFDLMIHDIDVIQSIVDQPITDTVARGLCSQSTNLDYTVAQLTFDGGILGTLTASHVTHAKVRTLNITTKDAYITLDYQAQDLTIQKAGIGKTKPLLDQGGYRTQQITESPYVSTEEPLKNELRHFLERVRQQEQPRVSWRDGLQAVENAARIVELANKSID